MHISPILLCLADLKKTLAVLLDNIMLRLGKLEAKVENIYNGTGANMSSSTSTATPSATNAEKVNVAGMYYVFFLKVLDLNPLIWAEILSSKAPESSVSGDASPVFLRGLTHLISCSVIYCMKLHWKRDWDPGFILNSPEWQTFPLKFASNAQSAPNPLYGQTTSSDMIQIRPLFMLHDPTISLYWFSCQLWDEEFARVEREMGNFFPPFYLDSRQHETEYRLCGLK